MKNADAVSALLLDTDCTLLNCCLFVLVLPTLQPQNESTMFKSRVALPKNAVPDGLLDTRERKVAWNVGFLCLLCM